MHSILKVGGLVVAGLLTLAAVAVPVAVGIRPIIGPRSRPLTERCFDRTPTRLARGRYLVTSVSGCFSCHGETDWQASGFPVKAGTEGGGRVWDREGLPFVTAPNITPDPETGAGRWTDDMLARAIREGIGHDGRLLSPNMWYRAFASLSDEDLASVVVYLRSLPPIRNVLPQTQIPLARKLRYVGLPEPILAPVVVDVSAPQKRGEYLANIADCAGCHTSWYHPDAPMFTKLFAGGNSIDGPNHFSIVSPNITSPPVALATTILNSLSQSCARDMSRRGLYTALCPGYGTSHDRRGPEGHLLLSAIAGIREAPGR